MNTTSDASRPGLGARHEPAQSLRGPGALDERKLWASTMSRTTSYGPTAIKVGKHLRWHPATVITWARQQERPAG